MATTAVAREPRQRRGARHTIRLFVVDLAMFAAFVLVLNVPLTGIPVHEWLGIAVGAFVIAHLVQHTNWIVTTTRRIFTATSFRNRLNYLMMMGLFAGFLAIIVSGLVISEAALPFLGIATNPADFWLWLHLVSVGWVIWLTALHVALNWKWIVNTARRYIVRPVSQRIPAKPVPQLEP